MHDLFYNNTYRRHIPHRRFRQQRTTALAFGLENHVRDDDVEVKSHHQKNINPAFSGRLTAS